MWNQWAVQWISKKSEGNSIMKRILCTFPADFGDIIWSLATTKALSLQMGYKFDFCCGDACSSLIPMISAQSYIDKAFFVSGWPEVIEIQTGVMMSNRAWEIPAEHCSQYDTVLNLGYQDFPNQQVIDFIADQQGLKLVDPIPFLQVNGKDNSTIAYGFSNFRTDLVDRFMKALRALCWKYEFRDVTTMPWLEAASWIKNAKGFVGSRGSNGALAHGVGQQNIFLYEPALERHDSIWGCDYINSDIAPFDLTPEEAAKVAASKIKMFKVAA